MKNLNFNDDEILKAALNDLDDKDELYRCDNNAWNADLIDNNQPKHSKGKKLIYTLVAVFAIVIIGASIFTILINQDKNFKTVKQSENVVLSENEQVDKEIDEEVTVINSVNDGFLNVEKNYLVNNKLPEEKIAELLKEECEYAQSLVKNGLAISFSLEETGCITVDLTQGDKYIYIPEIEGLKASGESGRIVTLQPNKSDFSNNSTDSLANNVMKSYDNYSFDKKDNMDESKVTLDAIINLKNSEVIIWDGHGNYTKKDHSILITGETAKHVKKLQKQSQKFKNDKFFYTKDETPRVAINYKFFNNHFKKNDFQDALIFLGTCSSGKDTVLADTLREKGAKTVFVTTNSISNDYCDKMTKAIFDNLIKGRNANDSLAAAIKRHGEHDKRELKCDIPDPLNDGISGYIDEEIKNWDNFFHPAEIKIIGSKKFKLRNNKKNIDEYDIFIHKLTAEEWVIVREGDFVYFKFSNNGKVKITRYTPEKESITAQYETIDDDTVYFGYKNGIGSVTRFTVTNRSENDAVDVEIVEYGETINGTMERKSNFE